jgi:hypothetical protein
MVLSDVDGRAEVQGERGGVDQAVECTRLWCLASEWVNGTYKMRDRIEVLPLSDARPKGESLGHTVRPAASARREIRYP